ncbi:MAG: hypothetical protein CSA66_00060 [Proteobacteria bacterium]|nr:MAG: hypothetical protein CSA66_00060 [Pseudomonadota bacterium]
MRADLDAGLVAVALKALAKAPADRYPTAAAMADALEAEVAAGGAVGPDDLAALVGSLLQDRRERWAAVLEAAQQATPPAPPAPPAAPPAPPAPGLNLDDPFDESSPAGAFLFEHDGSDLAAVTIPEPLAKPAEPSEQAATLSGLGGLKLATPEPEPDEASPPEAEAPSDTAPGLASAPPPIPEDEPALTGAAPRPFEPAPEPAPEPARRGWRAFDDGFEPDPFDDEEDEDDPPPVPSLQRLLAAGPSPEAEREPAATGASGGGLALEVLRVVRGRVRGAELLRRSGGSGVDRPLAGGVAKAALSEREIRVTPHAGVALAGAEAAGALTLQLGEGAELVDGDTTYRLRALVPPPPPKRGAARIPLAIYALALLIVAGVHLGTAPVLDGLEALGVTTAVDRPAPAEVFAEGTMRRPKPKRPPVAKPNKPKPRPNKVADKAPAPAPPKDVVSSVEAPPQIPKKMRQRISARMSGSRGKASTSSLIERLRTPRQGVGHTLKEVTTNIEAKAAGRQTDVHKVTGELLAMGGAEPQFATAGGGGEHRGPLAGEDVRGKITKKLSLKPNKSAGKVRGKVSGMRSRTKVKGSLDPALVYKVIDHNIGRIQSCYEKRLRVNPSLAGKITFRWKISTTGRVKGVRQHTSSLGDAKVSSCIQQILKRLRFPKPDGGEVEIFYPFIFRST